MDYAAFAAIYPDLPHDVAIYYSDVKRNFKLSHEQAYAETVRYARRTRRAVGDEPGKPAHMCRRYRLLVRREL